MFLFESQITDLVRGGKFLVLSGDDRLPITEQIFKRNPLLLDIVDLSENELAEVVRYLRSKYGYIEGVFRSFALDIGSIEFELFVKESREYGLRDKSLGLEACQIRKRSLYLNEDAFR